MNAAVLEKAGIEESYRIPMRVTQLRQYTDASYYICPRCGTTMEREFMAYCDRCGQCLNWKCCKQVKVVK